MRNDFSRCEPRTNNVLMNVLTVYIEEEEEEEEGRKGFTFCGLTLHYSGCYTVQLDRVKVR